LSLRNPFRLLSLYASAAVILIILPLFTSDYVVSVMLNILMWIALTESWIILSGYTGYISLGHAAFFGVGAYLMALLWRKLPFFAILPLGGLSSMLLAFAIGFPCLRIRGPYFVILTLGLSEFTKYLFINWEVNVSGTVGRILMGAPDLHTFYYSMLVIAGLAVGAAWWIRDSRFGTGLRSIKEDEEAAESLGINTSLYKWLAFGISAFFPGLVGSVMAPRWTYIDPYTVFNPIVSFQIIVIAFLGGVTDVKGPILGAIVLTLVSEFLWAKYPYYYMIILGAILIILVYFIPSGILDPLNRLLRHRSDRN
jgi:branched-chain amino acid transport system permease protein